MAFSFFAFSPSPLAVKEEETFPKQEKRFPTPSGTRKARWTFPQLQISTKGGGQSLRLPDFELPTTTS